MTEEESSYENDPPSSPKISSSPFPFELNDGKQENDIINSSPEDNEQIITGTSDGQLTTEALTNRLKAIPNLRIRKRQFPDNLNIETYPTYDFIEYGTYTVRGHRYHFQLSCNGRPLYHVKMKSKRPASIPIAEGSELHFSKPPYAGFLLNTDGHQTFSLRKQSEYGNELMTIRYVSQGSGQPKRIYFSMFLHDSALPQNLENKQPDFNGENYTLDFGRGKAVVPSVKNAIIVGSEDKYPYLIARKIKKDTMQFDAFVCFTPLDIIAFGISLFFAQN